jgi:hypothetical protein
MEPPWDAEMLDLTSTKSPMTGSGLNVSKIIAIVIVQVGASASILSLYFTFQPFNASRPWWHWLLVAFAIISCMFLTFREIVNSVRFAPKIYRSTKRINAYMHRWVSSGGRVVIFSRDMSWAGDGAIRKLLSEKARRNELTVCLERTIPLTNELQKEGAQVVTYQHLGHVPRSRFTIVDFGREGARVAVGVKFGNDHVIQEFQSGFHPFFAVAEDLVKFLLASKPKDVDV